MANRLVGNTYIIDSGQTLTGLSWPGGGMKLHSVMFYATDTSGELKLAFTANTADLLVHVRSNQSQPFTLPYYFGGCYVQQITPILVTAGTAFLHFV